MSRGLWQKVVEITEHNSQRQHALMMALARGEMPYGQFVRFRLIKANEAHDLAVILTALKRIGLTPTISCSA
jgi:hypothetical protein